MDILLYKNKYYFNMMRNRINDISKNNEDDSIKDDKFFNKKKYNIL